MTQPSPVVLALIVPKIPARTVSGNSGQEATTTAKPAFSDKAEVSLSVARAGRELPFAVVTCRRSRLPLCDATSSS